MRTDASLRKPVQASTGVRARRAAPAYRRFTEPAGASGQPLPSTRLEMNTTHSNEFATARMLADHDRLDRLCTDLERIADDLPGACPRRCARAIAGLERLPAHHTPEEALLRSIAEPGLHRRIVAQHHEDEGLARDIVALLAPLAEGDAPTAPETLGYMLRGFFTSCRRSMLIEELAIGVDRAA
jgi:hypothetical protein